MNLRFKSKLTSTAGFTLMEVMIAIFVLAFISMGIYEATIETYKLRDVLSREGDFHNAIRLSMNIMQRDINLIYNPVLMMPDKPPSAIPEDLSQDAELSKVTQFWNAAVDKTGLRPSHFIGTDSKMSFISLSHIRIYKDAPESELAKVTYEVRLDEQNTEMPGTYTLFKGSSPNVFEEDAKRDKFWVHAGILKGIKAFKIRYYRKDKDRWESSWDNEKEDFKGIYPDKVEVQLEVVGPFQINFQGAYVFRPEIPLNGLDPST